MDVGLGSVWVWCLSGMLVGCLSGVMGVGGWFMLCGCGSDFVLRERGLVCVVCWGW